MKYIVLPSLLFTLNLVNGQNLRLSAGYGFSVGEKTSFKKIMLAKTLQAGIEFEFNWNTSLITSLEYKQFQYSHDDVNGINTFSENNFISLPVVLRKYFTASKRSWLFTDFGIQGSYYYGIKNEIRNGPASLSKIKISDIGFNGGAIFATGLKTRINDKQAFDVGMYSTTDLFVQKRSAEWMKNSSLCFTISYYLELK